MERSDIYSTKGSNVIKKDADGWVFGYSEGGVQFLASGPKTSAVVIDALDPKDKAKLMASGEVKLDKA